MDLETTAQEPHGIIAPGYRLPAATVVGAVRLLVSDLDRSIAFYERVLGFRTVERSTAAAALAPEDGSPVLVRLETTPGLRGVARRGALGLFHFAILLPDRPSLGRFVAHLAAIGVPAGMSRPPGERGDLPERSGRPRHRGVCGSSARELGLQRRSAADGHRTAASRDVVAAGGGQPWTGMPAGTVMGHIHLHVGDLAIAEAFFHRALGFDKVVWNYPGALFLSAGGYHHHLGTNTWAPAIPPADGSGAAAVVGSRAARGGGHRRRTGESRQQRLSGRTRWRRPVARDPWGTRFRLVTR